MKLELGPVKSAYVAPTFGDDKGPVDPALQRRLRRPMIIGAGVIGAFVLGLGLWASLTSLSTGITAAAEVRAESNRKTMRHREGGTVRQILVKEGQRVRPGQPLLTFDDVEARAMFDVYQNQYDTLLAQSALFSAESSGRNALTLPAELTSRMSDPRVSALIRDQQFLFASRLQLHQSQAAVLAQRSEQQQTQVQGLQFQVESINEQLRLVEEELSGYRKLEAQGYAPKTLILRYQRNLAELSGRKGALVSEVARLRQQIGETRLQLGSLRDQRGSQAAGSLSDVQSKLSDVTPRFTSARQTLQNTVVRSPVDGYVFNLTQFTIGGVTGPGELLMDIVPAGTPLLVTAMVKPEDVDEVHVGMDARIKLSGLNARFNDDLPAKVTVVSADRITNERTGVATYRVDLRIDPKDLKLLKPGSVLTPGMPAQALIVTGDRTVMGFLISPITDTLHDAFREQ